VRLWRGFRPTSRARYSRICGIVKGAILPGYYGIEAGQSAVGDIFKWWVEVVCEGDAALHARLSREAARLKPGQSACWLLIGTTATARFLVDQTLSGLLLGQTLHSTRAEFYRALIEATAFGARAIIERIKEYGVRSIAWSAPWHRGEEPPAHADFTPGCHRLRDAVAGSARRARSVRDVAGCSPAPTRILRPRRRPMTSSKPKAVPARRRVAEDLQSALVLYGSSRIPSAASTNRRISPSDGKTCCHQGASSRACRAASPMPPIEYRESGGYGDPAQRQSPSVPPSIFKHSP